MKDKIYLMPFNALACCLSEFLSERKVEIAGFFDNNKDLQNKAFRNKIIQSPYSGDEKVIVCSYRQSGIVPQLDRLERQIGYYYEYCSNEDISYLLHIFEEISVSELKAVSPLCAQMKAYSADVIKNAFVFSETSQDVVINAMNVCITENCNLNCRNCSFLRPYFSEPKTYETDKVIAGFDNMAKNVSFIREALVIGGEPFLHADTVKITRHICESNKVGMTLIITNGAVLPKRETLQGLAGLKKLTVKISDYGELSKHKQSIVDMCNEFGVKCVIQEQMPWWEAGILLPSPQGYDESLSTYSNCNINCAILSEGKFSKCNAAMWRHLLQATPPVDWGDEDILEVHDDNFNIKLRKHMLSSEPLKACAVCSGKSRTAKQIPPAIQCKGTLPYNKY